ncbi:phage tail protein [Leifsonia shinshuensis]|uniref:Microcystin-dependent protein n=1 Tax=Leifsonia shinshuensis TaxID=150026 RepID=A0A853CUW5_9MICO|nr:tail fiber protein [Leifsonia shinshuensis]NYJ22375.1 microcystin-dependent protein [Leifsonia shinshuensis]
MSDQFVGEIRLVAFTFAPTGWAFCAGQLLPISQNVALFSLLGTTYGGNGTSNFALPNLQGNTPLGFGQSNYGEDYAEGEQGGVAQLALLQSELPAHTHGVLAVPAPGTTGSPSGAAFAEPRVGRLTEAAYGSPTAPGPVPLNPGAFAAAGGSQPHNNLQPSVALNYVIALQGVYPARS